MDKSYYYSNNKIIIKKMIFSAIYIAIFIILTFIPYTGYIRIFIVQITTLPILVAFATYHLGFVGAMVSSLSFGLGSYFQALTQGDASQLFVLPDIAILSRFFMGLSIYAIYKILKNIKLWKFFILASASVILNTFWVTVVIYAHNAISPIESFKYNSIILWLTLIYVNFIVELVVANILVIPLFYLLKSFKKNSAFIY